MEGFGGLCIYKCMCGDWPTYGAFALASGSLLRCWVFFLFKDIPTGIHARCKERKSRGEKCMVSGGDLTNLGKKEKRKTGAAGLCR
jgi:hypothetical protein